MRIFVLALVLLSQEKQKLISQKDALAAAKAEATKWNAAAWLAGIEAIGAGEGSVDLASGKFAGWRFTFAAKGSSPGELETAAWETFDGGATWKDEKKTVKESWGLLPLPEKLAADARLAVDIVKKNGVKTKQPSVKLSVERGWPVWRSTNDGEPIIAIDAVGGKPLGVVKTTLNDLLDRGGKGSTLADAMAAVTKQMTDWGAPDWGLVAIEGRSLGIPDLGRAMLIQAWKILVESKKPDARIEFTYHNGRLSGWNAFNQPTGEKTTPASEIDLAKAGGYVAGHPLMTDWARGHRSLNVEIIIDPDRMARKQVRVRVIDEAKSDEWAQAILDAKTGKITDFMKQ
jgi:hypothetical protein